MLLLVSTAAATDQERPCQATTRTITSGANTHGFTQNCVASLPTSKSSATAVIASVTNGGSYSLICKNSGQWNSIPTTSFCPPPPPEKSRGIRVDPGYFYSSHSGQNISQIALDVVTTLKNARVNTIYLYAYNSTYGAYYPTTYSHTTVEAGFGVQNIFGAILNQAHLQGLKVVAVVPLNNFKLAWQNNSAWRVKQTGQVDYLPLSNTYLLSASVPAYKSWYVGFINDLISNNPSIDQIEVVEPTLDYFWTGVPDQNPTALSAFNLQYPGELVGSQSWRNFRAQEFLNLVALFNQTVHARNKESGLAQSWTINSNGTLMNNSIMKDNAGFDFIGVATLAGTQKTDHLVGEFIWQQWLAEYNNAVFNPEWISSIGAAFESTLRAAGSSSDLIVHVEITPFSGPQGTVTPTNSEFGRTMTATTTLTNGVSVYDYNQIRTRAAFWELSQW